MVRGIPGLCNLRESEDILSVTEHLFRDCLGKLDAHKSMSSDGVHPEMLRELAEVTVMPIL